MAFNFDFISFIKELIGDKEKLAAFKEVVVDIKDLVNSINSVIKMIKG